MSSLRPIIEAAIADSHHSPAVRSRAFAIGHTADAALVADLTAPEQIETLARAAWVERVNQLRYSPVTADDWGDVDPLARGAFCAEMRAAVAALLGEATKP